MFTSAVNKAYKTLENEEGYRRCQEIVEEARNVVNESVSHSHIVWWFLIGYGSLCSDESEKKTNEERRKADRNPRR